MKRLAAGERMDVPTFYVDNVADYALRNWPLTPEDMPIVRPPFRDMWIEYRQQQAALDVYAQRRWPGVPTQVYCSAVAARLVSDGLRTDIALHICGPAGWMEVPQRFAFTVHEDGTLDRLERAVIDEDGASWSESEPARRAVSNVSLVPILMAISFMHCNNVRHVEHGPSPKQEKAARRRGRPASIRYYVLNIDPVREVLRRDGGADAAPLARALHACRGHFKDYRKSGLFGRIRGIFWWQATVRGDAAHGTVVKDYCATGPQEKVAQGPQLRGGAQ